MSWNPQEGDLICTPDNHIWLVTDWAPEQNRISYRTVGGTTCTGYATGQTVRWWKSIKLLVRGGELRSACIVDSEMPLYLEALGWTSRLDE